MRQQQIIERLLLTFLLCLSISFCLAQNKRVNAPPVAINDSALLGKNQSIEIAVLANDLDPDGDVNLCTIQVIGFGQIGFFQIIGNKIKYTGSTNQCGFDSLKYQITDSNNEVSNIATIYIEITCFNIPPIANNDNLILDEDNTDSVDIYDNDRFTDGPNVELNIIKNGKNGIGVIRLNQYLTYTPTLNYFGLDTIHYVICDLDPTNPLCDSAYVVINITSINDKPIAIPDSIYVFQGQSKSINIALNDIDLDGPSNNYTLLGNVKHGSIQLNLVGTGTYTATIGFTGLDSVQYELCDLASPNLCDTSTAIFFVQPVYQKPEAVFDTIKIYSGSSSSINILKNDYLPNGLDLDSVFFNNVPIGFNIQYSDSIINITPSQGFIGRTEINYFVKDLIDSISNTSSIIIVVNTPPVSIDRCGLQALINQSISINPFEFAIPGNSNIDNTKIQITKEPLQGSLSTYNPITQRIQYNANSSFIGVDTFKYKIYDVDGFSSEEILICIEIINEIPVSTNGVLSPNGDGNNDRLEFANIDDYPDNEVIVFDRNWNEVFHAKSYTNATGWDAAQVGTGTYYYLVKIRLNNQEKILKGYISLIK